MRSRLRFAIILPWFVALFLATEFSIAQERPIVLKASTVLDGKGKVHHSTIIVVEGGRIARVGGTAPQGAVTYDLSRLTVLPGWIDAHVHPDWHFDATGKLAGENEPKEKTALAAAANSWKMLAGGFTTVQRSEEHTSELQSRRDLVCRLLLEKKNTRRRRARRRLRTRRNRHRR